MFSQLPEELLKEIHKYLDDSSYANFIKLDHFNWFLSKKSQRYSKIYKLFCYRKGGCAICFKPVNQDYFLTFCKCSHKFECVCKKKKCFCRRHPVYHANCIIPHDRRCVICNFTFYGVPGLVVI